MTDEGKENTDQGKVEYIKIIQCIFDEITNKMNHDAYDNLKFSPYTSPYSVHKFE